MNESVSIVIGSCDAYYDVAGLYVQFLRKYWKECMFPIYVTTESKKIEEQNVTTITGAEGDEWVKRIIRAINQTESEYIWLTVDDLFISEPVDNNRMNELFEIIADEGIQYYGFPIKPIKDDGKRKHYKDYKHIYSISKSVPYGVNMGTAIWEKKELLRVLNDGIETAWDVENYFLEKASKMEKGYYEHYVDDDGTSLHFSHMIKKGKWIQKGVKEIADSGIAIDYEKRGYVPLSSRLRTIVVGTGNRLCPVWARAGVKKLFSKVGFKFATKY